MDFAQWAEKQFGNWGWRELAGGMLLAVAVFAMVAFSMRGWIVTLGGDAETGGSVPGVVSHLLERGDARGFIENKPATTDSNYDISIVTDSSFLIIDAPPEHTYNKQDRYTITPMIARHMPFVDGRPTKLHEYYQPGTRTFDTRRVLIEAIQSPDVDAVVLILNPFLYFNDWMAFASTDQRSKMLYQPGLDATDYRTLAMTLRPSDLLFDAASAVSQIYRRRSDISASMSRASIRLLPSDLPFPIRKNALQGTPYAVTKWVNWFYPAEITAALARSGKNDLYATVTYTANLGNDSVGDHTLRANIRTLKAWGKPAILYVPPINPAFLKGPHWPILQHIIRNFDVIAYEVGAKNVRLLTATAGQPPKDVIYHDSYHMRKADGFVRMFADIIEKYLNVPIVRAEFDDMFGPK
jgi:hypothetical protein